MTQGGDRNEPLDTSDRIRTATPRDVKGQERPTCPLSCPRAAQSEMPEGADTVTPAQEPRACVRRRRAANDLARLPDDIRPGDWNDRVCTVLEQFPPDSASPELAEALDLLGV